MNATTMDAAAQSRASVTEAPKPAVRRLLEPVTEVLGGVLGLVLLCYKETFWCRIVFVGSRLSSPGPQQRRFAAYMEGLADAAGHADRHTPLKNYCTGLLLPG